MTDNGAYADRDLIRAAHDVHDYHGDLPGYSPNQVWHDGCHVCEARGQLVMVEKLDQLNFCRAWYRAEHWNRSGLPDAARAELPLFRLLAHIQNRGVTLNGR